MKIGKNYFDFETKYYIMGILNVTPDSFSDGGKWNDMDAALKHTEEMIAEGCDILDIGGESTRPGYTLLADQEEIDRVVPVIEAVKARFDIPISLDTYKSGVAKAGLAAGADLINDIWGCKWDPNMAATIAAGNVPCCLMHNREKAEYTNYIPEVLEDLKECAQLALDAGVARENIILDPGIGFGKTFEHNLELMNHMEELQKLGYPVLLGTSRKSMIGLALDLPADQRVEGTVATTVMGAMKGCHIFRVHDIKENRRALDMTVRIMQSI